MFQPMMYAAAMMVGGAISATVPGTLPAAAVSAQADQQIIVHIVSREETVTIKSGPKSLLYSLTGTDGKIVIADATPDKFAELRPELYRNMKHFIAVHADASDAIGFAGMDER
jgi:hypothetical protein